MKLRFHTQTAGVELTAQQPEVNLARVTIQALAAVLGGTQSLHTNAYDEAIALPTDASARLALRTQQVIANETDLCDTVDPFAGSYAVETLTDDIETEALRLIDAVFAHGSAVAAIEAGFQKSEIERSAYATAKRIDSGEQTVVGVNAYTLNGDEAPYKPLKVDPAIEAAQIQRLATHRTARDTATLDTALDRLKTAAAGTDNVLYPLKTALAAGATVGEVCTALAAEWGRHIPTDNW
jgi:methylmalonyl-CoA mutase N-terminal domain/subunit